MALSEQFSSFRVYVLAVFFGIFAGFVSILIMLYTTKMFSRREKKGKPPVTFPGALPLFGNCLQIQKNLGRFLDWTGEMIYRAGPDGLGTAIISVPGQSSYVVTNNPINIEYILKTNFQNFGKGPVWRRMFFELLGDGIFSADGDNWYHQRKVAVNIFKVSNFRTLLMDIVRMNGRSFLKIMDSICAEGQAVDMSNLYYRFTLDTIGHLAFGLDLGSLSGKNESFMRAFDYCQRYINFRMLGHTLLDFLFLNFTPRGWKYQRCAKMARDFARDIVRERMEKGNEHPEQEDLLGLFMDKNDHLNQKPSEKYLADVILNFIIAGRDTTAQAMGWCTYLLSTHPDIQEKLYEELVEVFGSDWESEGWRSVSYDKIQKLPYLHCVALETLRLYPSVPKEAKWTFEDDVLPDGTRIEKGNWAVFNFYQMGRLPALWGDDCMEFKPERHEGKPAPSPFVFTAFQGGPRICLGQQLAFLELKFLISAVIFHYRLSLAPNHLPVEPIQDSLTCPMKNPLMVVPEKRSAKSQ